MFRKRIFAGLIDGLLYGAVGYLLIQSIKSNVWMFSYYADYYLFFIGLGFITFFTELLLFVINIEPLGHQLMGLKVEYENRNLVAAYQRSMLKAVGFGTIILGLTILWTLYKNSNQGLHDQIVRSTVCQK